MNNHIPFGSLLSAGREIRNFGVSVPRLAFWDLGSLLRVLVTPETGRARACSHWIIGVLLPVTGITLWFRGRCFRTGFWPSWQAFQISPMVFQTGVARRHRSRGLIWGLCVDTTEDQETRFGYWMYLVHIIMNTFS